MNCLLPLLMLIVPDLRNPAQPIVIQADDSYKKSVSQVESEWKSHVKRFWTGGDGHKFCQSRSYHCAAKIFVIGEDEIRVHCVKETQAKGGK